MGFIPYMIEEDINLAYLFNNCIASSNVTMFFIIEQAASKIGKAKAAPEPSPKRIFMCNIGSIPSNAAAIFAPGSSDAWEGTI